MHRPCREQDERAKDDSASAISVVIKLLGELERRAVDAMAVGERQAEAHVGWPVVKVGMDARW